MALLPALPPPPGFVRDKDGIRGNLALLREEILLPLKKIIVIISILFSVD